MSDQKTLLLDPQTWDLVVDASGNIAVAGEPYSLAQDAASACRLFQGELWWDTLPGVPYWRDILGHAPPLSLIKSELLAAALSVPKVARARVFVASVSRDRIVSGQVQVVAEDSGVTVAAAGF